MDAEEQRTNAETARVSALRGEINRLKTRHEASDRLVVAFRRMVHSDDLTELGELDHEIVELGISVNLHESTRRMPIVRGRLRATAPVGTPVIVLRDMNRALFITRTRSEAWQLGDGTWVVSVDGISGGYDLARCFYADNSEHAPPPDDVAPAPEAG